MTDRLPTETITSVALLLRKTGEMVALPRPSRHHHLFALLAFMGKDPEPCEQGFTTSSGRFVDRDEGLRIATAADQIRTKNGNLNMLFSEDVW